MSKKGPPPGERIAYAKRALEAAEFVKEAAVWAHRLVMDECAEPGDCVAAMRRASEKHSIPHGTLWAFDIENQLRSLLRIILQYFRLTPPKETRRKQEPESAYFF